MKTQIPYRNTPSNDLVSTKIKKTFFCNFFGCRGNKNMMEGFWFINHLVLKPEIHFYKCMICGNDYSKISNEEFVFYQKRVLYDLEIWKENISKKNISDVYSISNFEFKKIKYKFICSKIGCKPKRFNQINNGDATDILIEFCARCNRLL